MILELLDQSAALAAAKRLEVLYKDRTTTVGNPLPDIVKRGRGKRRCIVMGVEYGSIRDASKALGRDLTTVWYWVKHQKKNSRYL